MLIRLQELGRKVAAGAQRAVDKLDGLAPQEMTKFQGKLVSVVRRSNMPPVTEVCFKPYRFLPGLLIEGNLNENCGSCRQRRPDDGICQMLRTLSQ